MKPQELFSALTVLGSIPLGAKEQRVFAAIASETKGIAFDALLAAIGGDAAALRQLLARIKGKGMIETGRADDDSRTYKLSTAGKRTIKKATA